MPADPQQWTDQAWTDSPPELLSGAKLNDQVGNGEYLRHRAAVGYFLGAEPAERHAYGGGSGLARWNASLYCNGHGVGGGSGRNSGFEQIALRNFDISEHGNPGGLVEVRIVVRGVSNITALDASFMVWHQPSIDLWHLFLEARAWKDWQTYHVACRNVSLLATMNETIGGPA